MRFFYTLFALALLVGAFLLGDSYARAEKGFTVTCFDASGAEVYSAEIRDRGTRPEWSINHPFTKCVVDGGHE